MDCPPFWLAVPAALVLLMILWLVYWSVEGVD